jgi:hypothetical protein
MKKLLAGVLGFGLWCGPALLSAQSKDEPKKGMSADMREAIAFEHAKDVADARQARLEANHPSVPTPDDEHSANRAEKDPNTPDPNNVKNVRDAGPGQVRHDKQ